MNGNNWAKNQPCLGAAISVTGCGGAVVSFNLYPFWAIGTATGALEGYHLADSRPSIVGQLAEERGRISMQDGGARHHGRLSVVPLGPRVWGRADH